MMYQRHWFPLDRTAPQPQGPACLGGLNPSTAEHHVHCGMPEWVGNKRNIILISMVYLSAKYDVETCYSLNKNIVVCVKL